MPLVKVDLAAVEVSADAEATLITYALGSCIAMIAHDPVRRVGGMLHYMLPQSSVAPQKAAAKPAMFGDTGIPLLLDLMGRLGCARRGLTLTLVGGASLYDDHGTFDIGRRNYLMARKLLWRAGLLVAAEDVGGAISRTVRLENATGRVTVRSSGTEWTL